ncbi:ABC transporter permease [Lacticaseibacillus zhaodongensis]|uniref:ABC transporter permease n=1 Tax=Lacticaseibacillus zhaodongensis TaxID=2668065 RepID=UPI0012D2DA05|nr:ABC transporter permease [Lacticaseibacillus zhaodongensis]
MEQLVAEYKENSYTTYSLGFAKTNSLKANKRALMQTQISALKHSKNRQTFNAGLRRVDTVLGGHSAYTPANAVTLAERPMTKSEAKRDYRLIVKRDKISGTFARVFADIASLIVGILPTVIIISFCYSDRRSRALATIQSKFVSSGRRLFTQYWVSLIVLLLPVLAVGMYFTLRVISLYPNQTIDLLAFMKVTFVWVLPTLMVSSAVGFLTYQLFGNFMGFAFQIAWWLVTTLIGAQRVDGNYGWLFMPRHNSLHNVTYFYDHFAMFIINRVSYAILALAMVVAAILVARVRKGAYRNAFSSHHQRF